MEFYINSAETKKGNLDEMDIYLAKYVTLIDPRRSGKWGGHVAQRRLERQLEVHSYKRHQAQPAEFRGTSLKNNVNYALTDYAQR